MQMILSPTTAVMGRQFQQSALSGQNKSGVNSEFPLKSGVHFHGLTRKGLPELNGVTLLAILIKPILEVDGGTLVVPTQEEEVFRIFDLVSEEHDDVFDVLFPAVHVVAEKKIIGLWREPSVLKESEQIVELPVSVAADLG